MTNRLGEILRQITTRGLEYFGIYYSRYKGVVTDNKDPMHLNRVKLQIPQVTGDFTMNYWAFPTDLPSGVNTGMQYVPDVGDLVWVEFEFGNPRRPIWSHGYRGTSDYILEDLKNYKKKWLRTPSGVLLLIDDNTGTVSIQSGQGEVLEISEIYKMGEGNFSASKAETLVNRLESMIDNIDSAAEILLSATFATSPIDPASATRIGLLRTDLATLKNTLNDIKSNKVKIE